ncbi:hypothetical protein AUG19_09055 [archaeon 13_1_20CM_2_54_9]|nr:MAG: hypothetical protein AUJ07_12030 [Crenarchaeota archaeon 13_1_40CM_3_53_5]OLE74259.1 MAG: hypothetical protein AUG19_09055 [archaeon 13_1_20CM_2_54_9]
MFTRQLDAGVIFSGEKKIGQRRKISSGELFHRGEKSEHSNNKAEREIGEEFSPENLATESQRSSNICLASGFVEGRSRNRAQKPGSESGNVKLHTVNPPDYR